MPNPRKKPPTICVKTPLWIQSMTDDMGEEEEQRQKREAIPLSIDDIESGGTHLKRDSDSDHGSQQGGSPERE